MFVSCNPVNPLSGKYLSSFCLLCLFLALFSSCDPETREARSTSHLRMIDEQVITYNRQAVSSENDDINNYILRHHWMMQETPTGMRYMIYRSGKGKKIVPGAEVSLKYSVSLLNGNEVYNSDKDGLKKIRPGASEGETGLQEALLLMKEGDCAKVITPSHLGYGLLGDLKKIPASAALVYDIEILKLAVPAR